MHDELETKQKNQFCVYTLFIWDMSWWASREELKYVHDGDGGIFVGPVGSTDGRMLC